MRARGSISIRVQDTHRLTPPPKGAANLQWSHLPRWRHGHILKHALAAAAAHVTALHTLESWASPPSQETGFPVARPYLKRHAPPCAHPRRASGRYTFR